jgi:hypothetical protein
MRQHEYLGTPIAGTQDVLKQDLRLTGEMLTTVGSRDANKSWEASTSTAVGTAATAGT